MVKLPEFMYDIVYIRWCDCAAEKFKTENIEQNITINKRFSN